MLAKYPPRRGGFTLIELMVVIGIILVLSALAVTVAYSGILDSHKISGSSDRVAGWLLQARAKAQREGRPSGVRFIVGADGFIREAQLIEVPDAFNLPAGNQLMIQQTMAGAKTLYVVGPQAASVTTEVTPGDTLSIPSLGTLHRVTGFGAATTYAGMPAIQIFVQDASKIPDLGAGATGTPSYATPTFGFIRQARATMGEPTLLVPNGIAIDANISKLPPPNADGSYDVVFSPNGEVQNAGSTGRFVFWIRNPTFLPTVGAVRGVGVDDRITYESAGEMVFVVVYTKTGAVGTQPVPLPPAGPPVMNYDPFTTTRDGISTGL